MHRKRAERATPALFVTTFLKDAVGVRRINGHRQSAPPQKIEILRKLMKRQRIRGDSLSCLHPLSSDQRLLRP